MKVSRNELTACLKKAFEGLGFSVGDYEDAAAMVVWSEMHGFNGLQQLQQALPFLSNCPCLHAKLISDTDQQALLDGQQSSVLLCGSQTVRLACAIARQHGSGHVRLDNCHNRKFIIQRLVSAAKLGTALIAYWVDGSTGVKVMIEPYAKQPEYQEYQEQQEQQEYSAADITANQSLFIFAGSDLASLEQQFSSQFNLGAQLRRFSTEAMFDSYQFRLEQGIEIDDQFWSELDNLVARVLVESTDSSRAGAGD